MPPLINKILTPEGEVEIRRWVTNIANPVESREPFMMLLDALERERAKFKELEQQQKKRRDKNDPRGIIPDDAIKVLNEALRLDPDAITELFLSHRAPCNQALAEHPTIQVCADKHEPPDNPCPCGYPQSLGVLGIINGLFGVDDRGWGPISATVDEDSRMIAEFKRTTATTDKA